MKLLWLLAAICALEAKNESEEFDTEVKEVLETKEMSAACTVPYPIEECQWTYRSNMTYEDIVVRQFPAVGDYKNACSIHFQAVKLEQEGTWTCLVRRNKELNFTARLAFNLKVLPVHEGIEFVQFVQQATKPVGYPLHMWCKVNRPVEECQWTWEPFDSSHEQDDSNDESISLSRTVVKSFHPAGESSVDCSLFLERVLEEDAGLWHCGVRENGTRSFTFGKATSVHINHPGEGAGNPVISFEETGLKVGDDLNLTCKASYPVTECRWSHKYEYEELFTFKKQFRLSGSQNKDCSFQIQEVAFSQHGLWSCEAKTSKSSNFKTITTVLVNIFPYPNDVEFVLLTGKASKPIGSPVSLGCKVNWPVYECQWTLMSVVDSEKTTFIKQFHPPENNTADCSLHLDYILEEHQGFWMCGVRWNRHENFFTSPRIEVTLYPPVSISFMEEPEDTTARLGDDVVLDCVTTTPVDECRWLYSTANSSGRQDALVVKQFAPFGKYRRNCTVRFKSVVAAQDGLWSCAVRGPPNSSELTSNMARLQVLSAPGPQLFTNVSAEVLARPGDALEIPCGAVEPVRECAWFFSARRLDGTFAPPLEVARFPPAHRRDCSHHIALLRRAHDGLWRCALLLDSRDTFQKAPLHTSVFVERAEPVAIDFRTTADHKISMTCRLRKPNPNTTCFWRFSSHPYLGVINDTDRFVVLYNKTTGECNLTFKPAEDVLGKWSCFFRLKFATTEKGMLSAQLVLFGNESVGKLNWLVGVLASVVLVLTLLLFGISFYKLHNKKAPNRPDLGNSISQAGRGRNDPGRYTQTPTKIDFQFQEANFQTTSNSEAPSELPISKQNVYEKIGRYSSPATCKSIYENVS